MRVRPQRKPTTRRPDRGLHRPRRSAAPAPAPEVILVVTQHPHQDRSRRSGGPMDNASYSCGCGYVFQAAVSTSVACPHCGTGQAW